MPSDPHLNPGEGERFRRYARLLIDSHELSVFEHDEFFQAKKFDDLYGDIYRSFAPMTEGQLRNHFFQMLLIESYRSLPIASIEPFEISVHLIRIQATPHSQLGRPAPEGVHRDGYHFGSIHLMRRENLSGAANNIYDLERNLIDQTTLQAPMDSIYFNDAAIFHGVSPFEAIDASQQATRDMLILLYQPISESPQRKKVRRPLRRF